MSGFLSGPVLAEMLKSTVNYDWDASGHKVMLLKGTYVPDRAHRWVSDVVAHECDATTYVGGFGGSGRKAIAGQTSAWNAGLLRTVLDANDPATWALLGGTLNNDIRYAGIIREITNDGASIFFGSIDIGARRTNGTNFTVTFSADGMFAVPL